MFNIKVNRPQSIVGRCWNAAQDMSAGIAVLAIVLKLIGVVTWSWWWVLSPLWISGILLVAGLCALLVLVRRAVHQDGIADTAPPSVDRTRRSQLVH